MCVNGKMRDIETISGMWGGIKKNCGGVNSTMTCLMYCKNFCKWNNVLPASIAIK
jgi:hypothetical protein